MLYVIRLTLDDVTAYVSSLEGGAPELNPAFARKFSTPADALEYVAVRPHLWPAALKTVDVYWPEGPP